MTIQNFDLINNSRYLWNQIKKSGKFEDYPTEAYCIYSNFKRSGLSSTEFSEKTKIPKNVVSLLGACKKPNGDSWSELLLLISEVNNLYNKSEDIVKLIQLTPMVSGVRKYTNELITKLLEIEEWQKCIGSHYFYPVYLNYIEFDLSQWEFLKAQHKTTTIVQKDVKRAKKVREAKLIPSFKTDPVVLGTKEMMKGKGKPDKQLALRVVAEYRKLSSTCDSYTFKQFCEDIDAKEHYRSLNYYYHNFDEQKSKCDKAVAYTNSKSISEQFEVSVKDPTGETSTFVVKPNKYEQWLVEDVENLKNKIKEVEDLKRCLDEKDNLLKMYEEDNEKLKIQNDEKERYILYLTNQRDEVLNKLEVIRDYSDNFLKDFKK